MGLIGLFRAAGDAKDVTAALLPQQRQSGSHDPYHADIVCVEKVADLFVAGFFRGREQARAGVVDKNKLPKGSFWGHLPDCR